LSAIKTEFIGKYLAFELAIPASVILPLQSNISPLCISPETSHFISPPA